MTATVSNVLSALVTLWTGAVPDGWEVIDSGPPIDPDLNWLCVGFDYSDQAAVTVTGETSRAPALQNRETYTISSVLSCWQGDENASSVRDAVLTAFIACRDAVRADRKLGGLVTDADVNEYDLDQDVSNLGNVASIRFTTTVDAF